MAIIQRRVFSLISKEVSSGWKYANTNTESEMKAVHCGDQEQVSTRLLRDGLPRLKTHFLKKITIKFCFLKKSNHFRGKNDAAPNKYSTYLEEYFQICTKE